MHTVIQTSTMDLDRSKGAYRKPRDESKHGGNIKPKY